MSLRRRDSCYKMSLVRKGQLDVRRLGCSEAVFCSSLFRRRRERWEKHSLLLNDSQIRSLQAFGCMKEPVSLDRVVDVVRVKERVFRVDFVLPDESGQKTLLLKALTPHLANRWIQSLKYQVATRRMQKKIANLESADSVISAVQDMIDLVADADVEDDEMPLGLMLTVGFRKLDNPTFVSKSDQKRLLETLSTILTDNCVPPTPDIFWFFRQCCDSLVHLKDAVEVYCPAILFILRTTPQLQLRKDRQTMEFVCHYLYSTYKCGNKEQLLHDFVSCLHTVAAVCPHKLSLCNILNVILYMLSEVFDDKCNVRCDEKRSVKNDDKRSVKNDAKAAIAISEKSGVVETAMVLLDAISNYDDWVGDLSASLRPVPFDEKALRDQEFMRGMEKLLTKFALDHNSEVQDALFPVRENRQGWIQLLAPGSLSCFDNGETFCLLIEQLAVVVQHNRIRRLRMMKCCLDSCLSLASNGSLVAMELISLMLEEQVFDDEPDMKRRASVTLANCPGGMNMYKEVLKRHTTQDIRAARGTCLELTLISATDSIIARLVACDYFSGLQRLNLACSQVTNACANDLSGLKRLKHLNLWSTRFGDKGLAILSQRLHLETLNLCETDVTDKGLEWLQSMSSLKHLNLNSTKVTYLAVAALKATLPDLMSCNITYSDADIDVLS